MIFHQVLWLKIMRRNKMRTKFITFVNILFFILLIPFFYSCGGDKPKRPISQETIDSGSVEIYCDNAYTSILDSAFDMYRSRYKNVELTVKDVNARNALAHLLSGKTRVAIVGRSNLRDEDSLMQFYNVAPYYQMDIANDALVFFTNTDFPTDTLNDEMLFQVLTENKKFMDFLPHLTQEPILAIAQQNSSEYGNLINLVAKQKNIKRFMELLPNSDSVISFVKNHKNSIGICYLSQVQGKFFKLLRIGYTDKSGKYIQATKPVHQSYLILGEYPFETLLRLYLLEDRRNLPFWVGAFLEKEAVCVKYYERAKLVPCYAKYQLEDWRK